MSNSSPSPLSLALEAYRRLDQDHFLTNPPHQQGSRGRALHLNQAQLDDLVTAYRAGGTVYELATRFRVERRTVATQLKRCGVTLRRQSPAAAEINEMIRLYQSGLSLEAVGTRLGFVARTVQRHLKAQGIERRDSHGRSRS